MMVVAPRWIAALTPPQAESVASPAPLGRAIWEDTQLILGELASGPLKNIFTGQVVSPGEPPFWVADVLADFPLALLTSVDGG